MVGILCIITILLGLKKMVEILGFIGPIIIFITLFTGGIYLTQHWELIVEGMSIAPQESSLRMGTIFYGLACVMMVAAFFCNYVMIGKQAVPTLYLANTISPLLGYAFLTVIFLGIYSSAVPSLLTFCTTFFKEGTTQHRSFTAAAPVEAPETAQNCTPGKAKSSIQ